METSISAPKKRRGPKKKQPLEGLIQSGVLFIGDPIYMGDNPQKHEAGIIPQDACNPFRDYDTFLESTEGKDSNLLLPDSYRDNPIGRGCVVQLQQVSGTYQIKKRICKKTGKVTAITIKLYE